MANGRSRAAKHARRVDGDRDPGGFIALPWTVVDSLAYRSLSANARALLIEVARQCKPGNNGQLLLSRVYMGTRGWSSSDMLMKGKRELLDGGFLFETVKGRRPNRASWYAVTWRKLDPHGGYDEGLPACFRRGAYQGPLQVPAAAKPSREELYARWPLGNFGSEKKPVPTGGTEAAVIGPCHGTENPVAVP